MKCQLAFLWHMHQPYYRDMLTGESSMPWARLHGIHSYYDMVRLYEDNPNISATINFVPSLILQLKEYAEEKKSDAFLDHTRMPAEALNTQQKAFLLRYFFMANKTQMIEPYQKYYMLMERRGPDLTKVDLDETTRFFSTQDYLDIQVFYNLVWFGFKAKEKIPRIAEMLKRNGNFTEEDKVFVIESQMKILCELLDAIKRTGKNVEISTTPFFHPILPLLFDTNIARRSQKTAILPPRMSAPAHAKYQVEKALSFMESFIGHKIRGLWPAEGAVCPEIIPILEEAGVSWIATDEDILTSSGIQGDKTSILYKPYIVEHNGSKISVVFRDKELSDLISFSYYRMRPEEAARDLISRIKKIDNSCHEGEGHLITIILDGENPWENYQDGGRLFLEETFRKFAVEGISTTTIGNFITANPPKTTISKIHSGSWINANYNIWIGKPQKNQGWNYIKSTKDELDKLILPSASADDDLRHKAIDSFSAACGSDWFWWFDDDFDSAFKGDFDRIFRMHLKNAFSFLKRAVPLFLFNPIHRYEEQPPATLLPPAFIYPRIDGGAADFFEWVNAVRINVHRESQTMGRTEELFETIYFGFNANSFFLKIDPIDRKTGFVFQDNEEIIFYIHNEQHQYKLRLYKSGGSYQISACNEPEHGFCGGDFNITFAVGAVYEMSCPFGPLGFVPGEKLTIAIAIARDGIEIRHYSHINFEVPDETYELKMWTV